MLKAIERDEANRKAKREKAERTEATAVAVTPATEVKNTEPSQAVSAKPKSGRLGNFF